MVPLRGGWEWRGEVLSPPAQHPSPLSAAGRDRGGRGWRARATRSGLTPRGRARGGEGARMGTLRGRGASSARDPLAQHLLPALGGCGEQGPGAAGAARPRLRRPCGPRAVPRAAGGRPGRAAGWALAHVSPRCQHMSLALPRLRRAGLARILGSSGGKGCEAAGWRRVRGSGTLTGVRAQSRARAPASWVLCCPPLHSPASAPRPQAAPSPPSVFFLKNNISAKYFNQISSSVSAVLLNQCSPTHLGG